jgi:hypothetical protein
MFKPEKQAQQERWTLAPKIVDMIVEAGYLELHNH